MNNEEIVKKDVMDERLKKVKNWFKKPSNIALFLIILLSLTIGLRYFNINSTVWWDEADYVAGAKYFSGMKNTNYAFDPHRPIGMHVLWGIIFFLGGGESLAHFTVFIFSMLLVIFTYLLGKEMFNKTVGLIAAFMISTFWLQIFLTSRLLVVMPGVSLAIMSLYFFWKGYIKNKGNRYLALFSIFLALSFLSRAQSLLAILLVGCFIIITEKHRFLKNKKFWIILIVGFLVLLPYLLFLQFSPLSGESVLGKKGIGGLIEFKGRTTGLIGLKGVIDMAKAFPRILTFPYFIISLFSLIVFSTLFLFLDKTLIKSYRRFYPHLFLFMWTFGFIIHIAAFVRPIGYIEPYYLFYSFPTLFIAAGAGIKFTYNFLKKNYSILSKIFVIVIMALLLFAAYTNITSAHKNILSKKDSYLPVKQAGEWIKENSDEKDVVFTMSAPQTIYYAERKVYRFSRLNQTEFGLLIEEHKPKFFIVSIFEKHPDWAYTYPQEHNDTLVPVQAYQQNGQPVLVIYEFKY